MVDDLFELVQLDAGVIEAETTRARLDEVVHSAVATVQHQAAEKGLSLVAEIGGMESAACSPRLVRVIQNLLVNAVRHTPADGTVDQARRWETARDRCRRHGRRDAGISIVRSSRSRADPARHGAGAGSACALRREARGSRQSRLSRTRFVVVLPAP
jgi:signal transduction histidine kinase